jgi:histidinol-phosphate/aromatic aminotransferase/cobyric acid decarboxylase-like protein
LPPEWRFERAAEQAARCRELLAPLVEVVPGGATLVAFRADDPAALVAKLFEAGVVVRDLPGTGLVRVSCGWWTNEEDLERISLAIAT